MREENVGYRVDEDCIVHYFVDEDFERRRVATVSVLSHPALASAKQAFDEAFRNLDGVPRDTKAAIFYIFEAVEVLARQIDAKASRLTKNLAKDSLPKLCLANFAGHVTEKKVLEEMLEALGYWADALHGYRHGQAEELPGKPSEELAVYAISTGSAHIRWLAPHAIAAKST